MSAVCYPWTQVAAEDGSFYFWNLITNETTWDVSQTQTTKSQNTPVNKTNTKPELSRATSSSSLKSNQTPPKPPSSSLKSTQIPPKPPVPSNNNVNKPVTTTSTPPSSNNTTDNNLPPKPQSSSFLAARPAPRLRRSRSFTENTSNSWQLRPPKSVEPVEAPKSQAPPRPAPISNPPPSQPTPSRTNVSNPPPSQPTPSRTNAPAGPPIPQRPVQRPHAMTAPSRVQPVAHKPAVAPRAPPSAPRSIEKSKGSSKDFNFQPDKNLKNFGGHESISMPSMVVHVGNISSDALIALGQEGTEKRGFLAKQSGMSWKERWVVVSKGMLKIFYEQMDTIPRKMYDLRNSTVELEKAVSRKYAIHVKIKAEKKKHLVLAARHDEDYATWMAAFKVNGSVDLDYMKTSQAQDEKKQTEQRKMQEKQMAKAEDDYVKSGRKVDVQEWKQKQLQVIEHTDQSHCTCTFEMLGVKYLSESKYQHKIQVTFADQQWCIYRFEKQFSEAFALMRTMVSIKTPLPKLKADAKTNAVQVGQFLTTLATERSLLYSHPKAGIWFSRLIAPIQYGDEKADNFVMPFKIEL